MHTSFHTVPPFLYVFILNEAKRQVNDFVDFISECDIYFHNFM